MTVLIVVHAGALWSSAKSQVSSNDLGVVREDLLCDIQTCDGLIVIDGFLSDAIPPNVEAAIAAALLRSQAAGRPAARLWGCDDGGKPYAGWVGFGSSPLVYDSQESAAAGIIPALAGVEAVRLTGAWASLDGSDGCVCSVADVLRPGLPECDVKVLETALMVEQIFDDDPDEDDPEMRQ